MPKIGADAAINYHQQDFVAWQQDHLPSGFDVIVDVVGGDYLNKNLKVAALDSRIVILSMLGGRFSNAVDIAKCLLKRVNIHASTLRNRSNSYKAALINHFLNDFAEKLSMGELHPVIGDVFDWRDANRAHQVMESNQNIGKLILTVS